MVMYRLFCNNIILIGGCFGFFLEYKFSFIMEHMPWGIGTAYKVFEILDDGIGFLEDKSHIVSFYNQLESANIIAQVPDIIKIMLMSLVVLFVMIIMITYYSSKIEIENKCFKLFLGGVVGYGITLWVKMAVLIMELWVAFDSGQVLSIMQETEKYMKYLR